MSKKVFISYSHSQADWVVDRLVPVLEAGGAKALVDRDRFRAGHAMVGEMDATQDAAALSLLVLSPEYLASDACRHEMERAVARDPTFEHGLTVPVMRVETPLPPLFTPGGTLTTPLYVDLRDDKQCAPWDRLLAACGADLGSTAPAWLAARDGVRRHLRRGESVNLVVQGSPSWRKLLEHLSATSFPDLAAVDLDQGRTTSRRGLVEAILEACGTPAAVPAGEELIVLDRVLGSRPRTRLALLHFERVLHRDPLLVDFFAAVRHLIMEQRKLVALFHSRRPFAELLPPDHHLSDIELKLVELRGLR